MNVRLNDAVRDGEHRLWKSYLAEARATRLSGRPGQRFESLAAIRKALALPVPPGHSRAELRDEAIACLVLADLAPAADRPPLVCPDGEVALAPDGAFERYATIGNDGHVRIRRMTDGVEIRRLRDSGSPRSAALVFSPDGRFLTHRCERDVKLWRLDGPEPAVVLPVRAGVLNPCTAFSSDSRQLAIVHEDSIRIYDTANGQEVRRLATEARVGMLAFAPGQSQLAATLRDRVRVFDTESGTVTAELRHEERTGYVSWHPQRRTLATTCDDLKIRVWDVDGQRLLLPPLEGHQNVMYAYFNHAGDRLISNDWDGVSRLWDAQSGRLLISATSDFAQWRFSPDDRYLVAADGLLSPRLLRVATGSELRTLAELDGSRGGIYTLVASPDDRLLAAQRWGRHGVVFIDPAHGVEVGAIPATAQLLPLAFEPGGALLTYGAEVPVQRWPIRTNPQTGVVHVGPPQTVLAAHSDDARFNSSADARVLGIPAYTHTTIVHRPDEVVELGPCEDARRCAISPDGRWAVTGNHNCTTGFGAQVWDAHQPRTEVKKLPVGNICDVGFSPDGRWLVTTGGGFRLWRAGSWEEGPPIAQTHGENGAFAWFAFAPDSKLLALSAGVGRVRLVNPDTGSVIACLSVPEQTVLQPRGFSPDGAELTATGSSNHIAYTWDLRAIRAQLRELDLDWDAPDYPPPPPKGPPLRVQVDLGK
jgi:WD40 repeat protein